MQGRSQQRSDRVSLVHSCHSFFFSLKKQIDWHTELNHSDELKISISVNKREIKHPAQTYQLSPRSDTKSSIPYVRAFAMATCPNRPSISSVAAHMGTSHPSPDGATLRPVEDWLHANTHAAFTRRGLTETNIMKAGIRHSALLTVSAPTALE